MKKQTRHMTVSYTHRKGERKYFEIPSIRLNGKWLAGLGFAVGEKVSVGTSDNKLVITLKRKNSE
jgi:hypothetical protein